MRSQIALGLIIWSALVTNANGQNTPGATGTLQVEAASSHAPSASEEEGEAFNLSRIDEGVVKQFRNAWRDSQLGRSRVEGLVLVFRKLDGSYLALSQGFTNESQKFSFTWRRNAIAIVHTHPGLDDPKPSQQDRRVADKVGVPIFTITSRGMFGYEPSTKKIGKVMDGLDWLEASNFRGSKTAEQMLGNRIHITSK